MFYVYIGFNVYNGIIIKIKSEQPCLTRAYRVGGCRYITVNRTVIFKIFKFARNSNGAVCVKSPVVRCRRNGSRSCSCGLNIAIDINAYDVVVACRPYYSSVGCISGIICAESELSSYNPIESEEGIDTPFTLTCSFVNGITSSPWKSFSNSIRASIAPVL